MPCKCVCRADQKLLPKLHSGLPSWPCGAERLFRATAFDQSPRLMRTSGDGCEPRTIAFRRQDQRTTMTLVNIRNLGMTLSTPLFAQLNLVVNPGDRIGLVAANGRGKSTLLRCIAGLIEATEGEITRSRGVTIGYVAQDVPAALVDTPFRTVVLEALPAESQASESWRVEVALEQLEIPEAMREQPLNQLSGGWQRLAL